MIGTGLGNAIWQKLPEARITFVPGEGVANALTLHRGKAELGLMISSIAASGVRGEAPYKEVLSNLRAVTSLYASRFHFVVMADHPLKSMEDLKKNQYPIRIAVGDPGSSHELNSRRYLAEYGLTYKDIKSWGGKVFYKSMGEASDMMSDGLLDVLWISGTTPMGAVQELAATKKVRLLPLDIEVRDRMVKKYGYSIEIIPTGAYNFVTEDTPTFAHRVVLGTRSGVPADDIYKITKALVENLDYIHAIHKNLAIITPEFMATGTGVPLHDGAAKYYKEIGAIK
jgi:TRAP transporter TAXI family solute receptor